MKKIHIIPVWLLFALFVLGIISSCKQKNTATGNPETETLLPEITELPVSLVKDTFTFDLDFYNYHFYNNLYEEISKESENIYHPEKFRIYDNSTLFKIDGWEQNSYQSIFIIESTDNGTYAHLVSYKPDMQFIDSRVVFFATDKRMYDNVYSKIDFNEGEIFIMDQSTMLGDYSGFGILIDKNGKYRDLIDEDVPAGKDTIAISSCMGGLYGKFPLDEKWTLINFDRKKTGIAKTTRLYLDHVDNTTTLLDIDVFKGDNVFHFDVALKGEYTPDDIRFLPLAHSQIYNKPELMNLIKQHTDTISYFNPDMDYLWEITDVHTFIHDEGEYKLVTYSYRINEPDYDSSGYPVLLGITPDNDVVWLAGSCTDFFNLYSVNNDTILYVYNSSCGEGAMGNIQLFRINEGFERFCQESIGCD